MGYKIIVKGIEFDCHIHTKEEYDKTFGQDHSAAFTDSFIREIHFMDDGFSEALCRHEVTHAFCASSFLGEVPDISAFQAEEIFACIIEHHGPEICDTAKQLYENLKKSLQS